MQKHKSSSSFTPFIDPRLLQVSPSTGSALNNVGTSLTPVAHTKRFTTIKILFCNFLSAACDSLSIWSCRNWKSLHFHEPQQSETKIFHIRLCSGEKVGQCCLCYLSALFFTVKTIIDLMSDQSAVFIVANSTLVVWSCGQWAKIKTRFVWREQEAQVERERNVHNQTKSSCWLAWSHWGLRAR